MAMVKADFGLLLAPRFHKIITDITGDRKISVHEDFSGMTLTDGTHSRKIVWADLRRAWDADDFHAIDRAARNAARYIVALSAPHGEKRRAFRTKRRNILART